jgi:5-methylcytosine-specific restriction endonuclease McrA
MMPSSLQTLVLNADYRPLSTWPPSLWPPEDAVLAVIKDKVAVVETWDAVFRSPSLTIAVPKVVALKQYVAIDAQPKFCRRTILVRDRFTCQYCGKRLPAEDLTFDHVVPRSAGGRTCWTNILTACVRCNALKGSEPANYSGRRGVASSDRRLRPLKEPRRPTTAELLRAGIDCLPPRLVEDFGSWLYWSTELEA